MKTYKDWICRYYSEHEDDEEDGIILNELIRCKDCDLYGIVELKHDGTVDMRYKPSWCFLWKASMNEKDYCSYAVRRDNGKAD